MDLSTLAALQFVSLNLNLILLRLNQLLPLHLNRCRNFCFVSVLIHLIWTATIHLDDSQLASLAFVRRVTLLFLETVKFDLSVAENFLLF